MAQIDKPNLHFNTVTYTGNGSANNSITGVGFAPDLVWQKRRDGSNDHVWFDKVRGATKVVQSASTNAEQTSSSNQDTQSLDSDGFTVGTPSKFGGINANSSSCVAWNWKAGTTFTNDASATGIGTIDSTGRVNDTAGFSIVSWSGTGTAGTIKHGLSTTPKMIIVKVRNFATNWLVQHGSIVSTKVLYLDTTGAETTDDAFNNTLPTSSVFSVKTANGINASGKTYIAYCFAEKKGFSKFGSYTGNGNADGPFVYTGFKPAFVFIKRTDSTNSWHIIDNKRNSFNLSNKLLFPDLSDAEATSSGNAIDIISNGFKPRGTGSSINSSGGSYIYMAIAENPIVGSNNVAATAR